MSNRLFVIAILLLLSVLAPVFSAGALAAPITEEAFYEIALTEAGSSFVFSPPANGEYAVYVFSADGSHVQAQVSVVYYDTVVAEGKGRGELAAAWLTARDSYTVTVSGTGNALVEVARKTLSRCAGDPLSLAENEPSGRMLALSGDAHWFRIPGGGTYALTCVPDDPALSLSMTLFDAELNRLQTAASNADGSCMTLFEAPDEDDCYVRVSSPSLGTGYYEITLIPENTDAAAPAFDTASASVPVGQTMELFPRASGDILLWSTSDPALAVVTQSGSLTALAEGTVTVTAAGFRSSASIQVELEFIAAESISFLTDHFRVHVGETLRVYPIFEPEDASDRRFTLSVADTDLAGITKDGMLLGKAEGETVMTAQSADGKLSASVPVTVYPPERRYRALLIGEQNYPASVNTLRNGSQASVDAIASMLNTMQFDNGRNFTVTAAKDVSRPEFTILIRETFANATEEDISLLYITCHGSYTAGMSYLQLVDGSMIAMRELERELRRIPGRIVLLLDYCGSGGALTGEVSNPGGGTITLSSTFPTSKYLVIASAERNEKSYRADLNPGGSGSKMTTLFARALCDAGGWDIDTNDRGPLNADTDYDRSITFRELCVYLKKRVKEYTLHLSELNSRNYVQTVCFTPDYDTMTVFARVDME